MPLRRSWTLLGWVTIAGAALVAGCSSSTSPTNEGFGGAGTESTGTHPGAGGGDSMSGTFVGSSTGSGAHSGTSTNVGGGSGAFDVEPTPTQVVTVVSGMTAPTAQWTAKFDGNPVSAGWSVDRGEVGTITTTNASTGVFTPSGTVGGYVNVTAGLTVGGQDYSATREVLVKLTATQNGPTSGETGQVATDPTTILAGGGIGGVGGVGLGGAVDQTTQAALDAPADDGSALGLGMLYPYDKTVFPRGLLAPLLMWTWMPANADAIKVHLHTKSGSYDWTGSFSAPAILAQTGGQFVNMPIPQDVWDAATNSAGTLPSGGADTLTMDLVVAQAGVAHGPVSETWTVAPGRLNGVIYYNSYGTHLAENLDGAIGGDGRFGAAVLGIHVGDSGPTLVAGSTSVDSSGCRVCHSVASSGSRLVVQHGDSPGDYTSSAYDLTPTGATENVMALGTTFPALYPDGSNALGDDGRIYPLPDDTTPLPTTGLAAVTTSLGSPQFSADGKAVAFNPMTDPTGAAITPQQLVVMKFDPATLTFSAPTTVVDDTGASADTRPGWAAFLPDSNSVVFHHQSSSGADGNGDANMHTRKGAKAQIAWASASQSGTITPLNALNGLDAGGTSYLPVLASATPLLQPNGTTCAPGGAAVCCSGDGVQTDTMSPLHDDDVNQNYEPTVNPIASGGYAWVVFTSRRMYGNVATIGPYCSDPRGADLVDNVTPKKLWVAAIDLNAHAGTDSSHPAFYLPAQELTAGNSRGFWVLDPCKADGSSCETGDQCCNGFCEPNGEGGALVCSNMSHNGMCSMTNEKCTTSSDCCDQMNDSCIGGFCVQNGPH
jgi:hypothetical protein